MTLRILYRLYKPYIGRITIVAIAQFMAAGLIYAVAPWLTKIILNQAVQAKHIQITWACGFIGIQLCIPVLFRISEWVWLHFEPLMRHDIANHMMDYLSLHSFRFFQNQFAGNLSSKLQDALLSAIELLNTVITDFGYSLFGVLTALVAIYTVNITFAILLTLWVVTFFAIPIIALKTSVGLSRKMSEAGSKILGIAVDVIANMMTVKLFVGYGRERQIIRQMQQQFTQTSYDADKFLWWINIGQSLSFAIYNTICWVMLIVWLKVQKVTPGDFILVMAINGALISTLWNASSKIKNVVRRYGALKQAFTILEIPHEVLDAPHAQPLKITTSHIQFNDVVFSYDNKSVLFNKLSIAIPAGQKVGLVGYSGGGKTTFINLLLRLLDVQGGTISINDHNIADITQDSLRQNITVIPQDPALFHRSLFENIAYGKPGATADEVAEAAHKAQIHDFITSLPQGYDTEVGERGIKLSGGQRQRIAIARALLKNAPIVIMDEATSQLDSVTEKMIQNDVLNHMQGKTVIVIAHRLSTLTQMDRILVFEKGQIIQDGTHEELSQTVGLYKTLWDTQIGGILPVLKRSEF